MSKGPFFYGMGSGWVTHSSGQRLTKGQCTSALAQHLAASKDPQATERARAQAKHKVDQLTEAMRLSFETAQETLPL
jgi:hypothetical protein